MSRINTLIIFFLGLIVLTLTFVGKSGFFQLLELRGELSELTRTKYALDKRISDYKQEIGQIKASPEALEKKAREDLGYAREDEVIYKFPE